MKRVLRTIFIIAIITMMGATVGETAKDGRFIVKDNETILDTRTNLMWVAKDNGSDINWGNAKSHCENYRGGGYKDWRMPTQDELAGLYDANKTRPSPCYRSFDIHVAEELREMDISKLDKSRHRNLYGQLSFFSVC